MISLVIVDDEKNIREGLRDLFPWEELGITVTCAAANGKEALSYIETHGADLVLADIRMPVMDGLELARHIQNSCPKTRVVLLSAYTDFAYAKKALRLGVCQYITKPVDYQELIDTIKHLTAPRPETAYQGYYQEMAQKILRYIEENPAQATLSGAAARSISAKTLVYAKAVSTALTRKSSKNVWRNPSEMTVCLVTCSDS